MVLRVAPDIKSGYGVGSRPEDSDKTLQGHEGSHGAAFINFIRNNIAKHPYPEFDANEKDLAKLRKNIDAYARDVNAFRQMLNDAMEEQVQSVDCVGKTIEQYSREHNEPSDVKCK